MSAKPPIVVRFDGYEFHFTDTSDHVLHGIRINSEKDGKTLSTVVIDTIEPHKTAVVDLGQAGNGVIEGTPLREATITCVNYSKPIKLFQ